MARTHAELTEADVQNIRVDVRLWSTPSAEIAERYGIPEGNVRGIVAGALRADVPDRRISPDEMFLKMAHIAAERATCQRLKVGAIITDAAMTTIWSMGFNGNARGLPNGCTTPDEPGNCGCDIHAEINALIKAPYHEGDLVMFCTHSPCRACAKAIINSRVRRVVYRTLYRSQEGVDLLRSAGIEVAFAGES
jgi:dCMP deaminase